MGIEPNVQTIKEGFTPLHIATIKNHKQIVETLLQQSKTNPNFQDIKGKTPLHYAAIIPDKSIFNLLLEKGSDIFKLTKTKSSILHIACEYGTANDLNHLFTEIPEIKHLTNLKDIYGNTPLHLIFKNLDKHDISSVCLLLTNGTEPLITNNFNKTPSDNCLSIEVKNATTDEHQLKFLEKIESIKKLLPPTQKTNTNNQPIRQNNTENISFEKRVEILSNALGEKNSPKDMNEICFKALHQESDLLNKEFDQAAPKNDTCKRIINAVKTNNHKLFDFFVIHNEKEIPDYDYIILIYASIYDNNYAVERTAFKTNQEKQELKDAFNTKLIYQLNSNHMSPLFYACFYGNINIVISFFKILTNNYNDELTINKALYYAVLGNNTNIVEYLLTNFIGIIDPLFKNSDELLSILDITSICNPNFFILFSGFLLAYKNKDIFNHENRSDDKIHPLHLIYFYGHEEIIYRTFLLFDKISIYKNKYKQTITIDVLIKYALDCQSSELTVYNKTLEKQTFKSICEFKDSLGNTPLFYAIQNNNLSSFYEYIDDSVIEIALNLDKLYLIMKHHENLEFNSNQIHTLVIESAKRNSLKITRYALQLFKKECEKNNSEQTLKNLYQTCLKEALVVSQINCLRMIVNEFLQDIPKYTDNEIMQYALPPLTTLIQEGNKHTFKQLLNYIKNQYSLDISYVIDLCDSLIKTSITYNMLYIFEYLLTFRSALRLESFTYTSQDINEHIKQSHILYDFITMNNQHGTPEIQALLYSIYGNSFEFIEIIYTKLNMNKNKVFYPEEIIYECFCKVLSCLYLYKDLFQHINVEQLVINGVNTAKGTLLAQAITCGYLDTVKFLLSLNIIDINQAHNNSAKTPLELAYNLYETKQTISAEIITQLIIYNNNKDNKIIQQFLQLMANNYQNPNAITSFLNIYQWLPIDTAISLAKAIDIFSKTIEIHHQCYIDHIIASYLLLENSTIINTLISSDENAISIANKIILWLINFEQSIVSYQNLSTRIERLSLINLLTFIIGQKYNVNSPSNPFYFDKMPNVINYCISIGASETAYNLINIIDKQLQNKNDKYLTQLIMQACEQALKEGNISFINILLGKNSLLKQQNMTGNMFALIHILLQVTLKYEKYTYANRLIEDFGANLRECYDSLSNTINMYIKEVQNTTDDTDNAEKDLIKTLKTVLLDTQITALKNNKTMYKTTTSNQLISFLLTESLLCEHFELAMTLIKENGANLFAPFELDIACQYQPHTKPMDILNCLKQTSKTITLLSIQMESIAQNITVFDNTNFHTSIQLFLTEALLVKEYNLAEKLICHYGANLLEQLNDKEKQAPIYNMMHAQISKQDIKKVSQARLDLLKLQWQIIQKFPEAYQNQSIEIDEKKAKFSKEELAIIYQIKTMIQQTEENNNLINSGSLPPDTSPFFIEQPNNKITPSNSLPQNLSMFFLPKNNSSINNHISPDSSLLQENLSNDEQQDKTNDPYDFFTSYA